MPRGPGAAGAFGTGERVFVGVSGPPVNEELHPRVIEALDAVPEELRPSWHGSCAEPKALTAALDDGYDLPGGTMVTVRIARNDDSHGNVLPPCSACAHVLDQFEVRALDA